jgi:hypothetical protein
MISSYQSPFDVIESEQTGISNDRQVYIHISDAFLLQFSQVHPHSSRCSETHPTLTCEDIKSFVRSFNDLSFFISSLSVISRRYGFSCSIVLDDPNGTDNF